MTVFELINNLSQAVILLLLTAAVAFKPQLHASYNRLMSYKSQKRANALYAQEQQNHATVEASQELSQAAYVQALSLLTDEVRTQHKNIAMTSYTLR